MLLAILSLSNDIRVEISDPFKNVRIYILDWIHLLPKGYHADRLMTTDNFVAGTSKVVTRRTLTVATAARAAAGARRAAITVDCFAQLTLQLKIRARHGHS